MSSKIIESIAYSYLGRLIEPYLAEFEGLKNESKIEILICRVIHYFMFFIDYWNMPAVVKYTHTAC